jgi:hypothetical protein
MDKQQEISKHFSRYLTAFCTSKAMLEDYAKVVSKLEGVNEQQVKERVEKRAKEIAEEIKQEQKIQEQ